MDERFMDPETWRDLYEGHKTPEQKLMAEIDRLRAALDKITKHPDCHRLVMQIACEALEGRDG